MKEPKLNKLKLTKGFISVFGSGNSILQIPKDDLYKIKEKSFTIYMNYAPCYFSSLEMDALIWMDMKVSRWLSDFYNANDYNTFLNMYKNENHNSSWIRKMFDEKKKDYTWIAREKAFIHNNIPNDVHNKVDYWYSDTDEHLFGNYTILHILQLIHKYLGEIPILLFGVDNYVEKNEEGKWYDKFIKYDIEKRGAKYDVKCKVKRCSELMEKYCKYENIYNCNLNSGLKIYKKMNWRSILL